MKFKISLFFLLINTVTLFAQKKQDYKQKSEELRKSIWQSNTDIFASNDVPDELKAESAVILARSFEMQRESSSKFKFMVITATNISNTNKTSIYREKVKINDKASLESFSKLEYEKVINKTQSLLFMSVKNKTEVFVGVKMIKPDGKEVIINTDEEVLLSTNNKNQTAKLAIPGLQVGDILDYYICTIKNIEGTQEEEDNKYFFFLADEYPVLKYQYNFQYNKRVNVTTLSANGAPKLTESSNAAGDKIYTLKGVNMPKIKEEIWTSWMKNTPYFTISSNFKTKMERMVSLPTDNFDPKKSILENRLYNYGKTFNVSIFPYDNTPQKKTESIFKSKELKTLPLDSTMKVFYNHWKYNTFFSYGENSYDMGQKRNFRAAYSRYNASFACQMLCDMKIPHDLVITTSKYANSLENVFEDNDFDVLIRLNAEKPLYMAFDRFNTNFNELPSYYEGQKAFILTPTRHSAREYTFAKTETTLPKHIAEDHKTEEFITASFLPNDMQTLSISRNVKQRGFMRLSDQLSLLLAEDVDNELTKLLAGEELKKRISGMNVKRTHENIIASMGDARKTEKQNFTDEIKNQYQQDPKDIIDYKIINSAITNANPFEFKSTFTMDGFLKKAGSNYIFNVGKLIGTIVKLEDKDRTRQSDIVMPAARTLNYHIEFEIPAGYTLKGLSDLNANVKSEMGAFKVSTATSDKKIIIEVSRVYEQSFAPKEKWDSVLQLIDAAYEFADKKVLLEKAS